MAEEEMCCRGMRKIAGVLGWSERGEIILQTRAPEGKAWECG